jgi:hypothetical protein
MQKSSLILVVAVIILLDMYYQLMTNSYSKKSYVYLIEIGGYYGSSSNNNEYDRTVRDVELIPSTTTNNGSSNKISMQYANERKCKGIYIIVLINVIGRS